MRELYALSVKKADTITSYVPWSSYTLFPRNKMLPIECCRTTGEWHSLLLFHENISLTTKCSASSIKLATKVDSCNVEAILQLVYNRVAQRFVFFHCVLLVLQVAKEILSCFCIKVAFCFQFLVQTNRNPEYWGFHLNVACANKVLRCANKSI